MRTNYGYKIILFYKSPNQAEENIQETVDYFETVEEDVIIVEDLNIQDRNWDTPYECNKTSGAPQIKEKLTYILFLQGKRR